MSVLETKLQPGARVLDVGSGSGILTACFALMVTYLFGLVKSLFFITVSVFSSKVGTNGLAVGVEHVEELTRLSARNIQNWLDSGPMFNGSVVDLTLEDNIKLVTGDGRQGYPPYAPYDVINVGAAAPTIPQEVSLFSLLFHF